MIVKAGRADLVTADTAQDELTRLGWLPALLVTVLAEHEGLKLMRFLRFALRKTRAFLKNEHLTPPPLRIKIPSLSTESRELAFLNWLERLEIDRRSGVFFYDRKTVNLPFTKILVKAQWWTVWEIERSPFTLINGTPILNSSSPTNWRLFVMISKTLIRESQNDKLKLNSCF